ncbi:MAG: peptidoglycan-associated lipoprotein Pal [Acidobacteriaceae bacterium]|nr:peptidoglycan-associated lipoprotein Pal [Acidobacteriaceae bacterium]
MRIAKPLLGAGALVTIVLMLACGGKKPPIARPTPPPPPLPETVVTSPPPAPAPAEPVAEQKIEEIQPVVEDTVNSASLDELNRNSPLQPVFFDLDSDTLNAEGRRVLDGNARVLAQNASWMVLIEGHCDERGSAEYNLALGERRALAARAYLLSLGLSDSRVRTVSYGKEFPFVPGHDESAYSKNRRAHFVVTAK